MSETGDASDGNDVKLTRSVLESKAAVYPDVQPLYTVEREHLEMLPETFAEGDYGWRDAEWVVQWYYRRFLGAYPDRKRRAVEDAYGENSYEEVHAAITAAVEADDAAAKLANLTGLDGVDVPVGSAFLQFIDPERHLAVGEREWGVLRTAGELTGGYPDPPSVEEYERYLSTCQAVADRCECDLQSLYRAIWVLGEDETTDDD